MFLKPTRNLEAVLSINENRHAIKHKLNYEITKDTKMDFWYIQTDNARISKRAIKKKNPTLATEGWQNEKEVSKNRSMEHKSEVRLRVVSLSLSPSCVTRKKIVETNGRVKSWGRESTRKEGLPPKPKTLPFHGRVIFWCEISNLIKRSQ